jgi:serine protein kinase
MSTNIFEQIKKQEADKQPEQLTMEEYFELCKNDPSAYATPAERLLNAIGEPVEIDTSTDPRLGRIFQNRHIRQYPAFKDFFGMEDAIESIVSFFRHAAQGLEEKKQILYLLGPVGGGKSSLAETLKALMEKTPIYTIAAMNPHTGEEEMSPIFESPLGLINANDYGDEIEEQFGIPRRLLNVIPSPWALERLKEAKYDLTQFKVVKIYPSVLNRISVAKTEPGDENNQDISTLVGKVNIRELENHDQDHPDAYSYSGGLCRANQGIMEFVEMFKAPIKMLNPLLTATQEGHYNGTANFGAIPFGGVVMAHSNESEWEIFRNDSSNEAFLDRVCLVRVPYCLRIDEEIEIYKKLLKNSQLSNAPTAPDTLKMLARFVVMTRIADPENSQLFSKARIYNGEDLKDIDPQAKSVHEYQTNAGVTEGMSGVSTRFAFKVLSKTFNYDREEVGANPVHLMHVLLKSIEAEQLPADTAEKYRNIIKSVLAPKYCETIGDEIQKAYLESYSDYGQNLFDRYIKFADAWLQQQDYRDKETGEMFDLDTLDDELKTLERAAGIHNVREFRQEVVNYVLRAKANNEGVQPKWNSYEKLRKVIEKKMFSNTEDLLPVISFTGAKASEDDQKKHDEFVERMCERGYTPRQVRLVVDWHSRFSKNS